MTSLQAQECWETLQTAYVKPTQEAWAAMTNNQRNETNELKKKEHRAKYWIQNSVDDYIFDKITSASTTHEAWEILKAAYQDEKIVQKVFQSMPKKYDVIVTAILESKDLTTFSIEQLIGSLLAHETRLILTEDSMEQAFKAQLSFGRGRGREYRGDNKRGRGRSKGRSKYHHVAKQWRPPQNQTQRSRAWSKYNAQCYYCKKFEHYENECKKNQSDQHKGNVHLSNNEGESSETMFLSCNFFEDTHNKDFWLLDSGCSNHMTGNKNLLSYLDASITS
eukprot:PITA_04164